MPCRRTALAVVVRLQRTAAHGLAAIGFLFARQRPNQRRAGIRTTRRNPAFAKDGGADLDRQPTAGGGTPGVTRRAGGTEMILDTG